MKIFVIGGTGRVGSQIVSNLKQVGHTVAGSFNRSTADSDVLVHLDLHDSVAINREKLRGYDVVYFAAGSAGGDLVQVDLYGSMKIMQAAKEAGVSRFIQISSAAIGSIFHDDWYRGPHGDYLDYNIIKYVSDEWLIHNSGLPYTILRPGVLMDESGSGKVTFDVHHRTYNAISNVALVAAKLLDYPRTINRVIAMGDGHLSVDDALAELPPVKSVHQAGN
ncbi:NAD(P)H-binding protein [Secundilactobacillus collinoides]|uniref:Nucleoside-diphosphate-sugar epimerase n=1 Tax=Secundilactobacillus collinoides DSM 20515 = JCM 1123 TaxID=1423733 RepID=A0A0R2BN11_SECCO|nr:NAD(P)H-binding protein [Secundilactobacillus collinoides]KRM77126.1 nucleoside-diphosphate-sugar epimerase [Secundilactobacillus collinoides DSM 20515 = JCM 1123]